MTPSAGRERAPGAEDVYVALGSNLGDRRANLRRGLADLTDSPGIEVVAVSTTHETEPVGPPPQGPYLNAAAHLSVWIPATDLLVRMLEIETTCGRQRGPVGNMPRTLDLDLLFYGSQCIDLPGLTVPHPRLHERGFVLEPLREIAPEFRHPVLGETVSSLAAKLGCEPR